MTIDCLHGVFNAILVYGTGSHGTKSEMAGGLFNIIYHYAWLWKSSWGHLIRTGGCNVSEKKNKYYRLHKISTRWMIQSIILIKINWRHLLHLNRMRFIIYISFSHTHSSVIGINVNTHIHQKWSNYKNVRWLKAKVTETTKKVSQICFDYNLWIFFCS